MLQVIKFPVHSITIALFYMVCSQNIFIQPLNFVCKHLQDYNVFIVA